MFFSKPELKVLKFKLICFCRVCTKPVWKIFTFIEVVRWFSLLLTLKIRNFSYPRPPQKSNLATQQLLWEPRRQNKINRIWNNNYTQYTSYNQCILKKLQTIFSYSNVPHFRHLNRSNLILKSVKGRRAFNTPIAESVWNTWPRDHSKPDSFSLFICHCLWVLSLSYTAVHRCLVTTRTKELLV